MADLKISQLPPTSILTGIDVFPLVQGGTTKQISFTNFMGSAITYFSATAPLIYNNLTGNFSITQSSGSTNGYLSSTDWNTFNNKQNALTFGNLTDGGSDGIIITGGTGAVIGSGTSVTQQVANISQNGYLTSIDWSHFNSGANAALGATNGLQILSSVIQPVYGSTANTITQGNDARLSIQNVVNVKLNPGAGEFSSVVAALASIVGASPTNPYLVKIGPGVYNESPITIPANVDIQGSGADQTFINAVNANTTFFTLAQSTTISNLVIQGATGLSGIAVVLAPTGPGVRCEFDNVGFGSSNTLVQCINPTFSCALILRSSGSFRSSTFLNGIVLQSSTNPLLVLIDACIFNQTTGNPSAVILDISGTTTNLKIFSTNFQYVGGVVGTHVNLYNGATLSVDGIILDGGALGLNVPNTGTGPMLYAASAIAVTPVTAANIQHSGITGALNVIAHASASVLLPGISLQVSIIDPNGNTYSSGTQNARQPNGKFTDITTISENASPVGLLTSGAINTSGSFNISVAAGTGYLQQSDNSLTRIDWPITNATVPASATTYVYFDLNAVLQQSVSLPNVTQNVFIGRVISDTSSVIAIDAEGFDATHAANSIGYALRNGLGAVYSNGSIISEVGTRMLSITAGSYYFGELNYLLAGANPAMWISTYQNGTGGYTDIVGQTIVDNAQWDNGTGTLTPISSGQYAKHAVYSLGTNTGGFANEDYFLVYSQAQYTALTLAEQGALPAPPNFITDGIVIIGSLIVQQGTTHIVEIRDERPISSARRASVVAANTFHSNLLGLTVGNDHPQYFRVDGTESMTGNMNLGGFNITNVGTINFPTLTASLPLQLNGSKNVISSAIDLTTAQIINTLPIVHGGTNSSTALNNNRVIVSSAGSIVESAAITGNRALVSNASGIPVASITTDTEITYVSGVTSSIQTQLNGKQATGNYITALTGDVTATGPGSVAATLATVNANVGTFGSSTSIPTFTVNGKGLITAASGNAVIAPAGTLAGTTLNSTVVNSSLVSVGTITSGTWNGTTIAIANGGTGQTTQSTGFNALSPMTTLGDIIYGGAAPAGTGTRLAGNTSSTLSVLTQTGTGIVSAPPIWTATTGSGLVVLATSPTVTGTLTATDILNSGTITNTYNGTASTPGLYVTGVPYSAGSTTTNFPQLLVQDGSATPSSTWSSSGTALGVNSSTSGMLFDVKSNGSSRFTVSAAGLATATQGSFTTLTSNTITPSANNTTLVVGQTRTYTTNTMVTIGTNTNNTSSGSGTLTGVSITPTFAVTTNSASNTANAVSITPTWNFSGTTPAPTITDLFVNSTETAIGTAIHKLMDLQVGSVSKFKVDNTGLVTTAVAIPVTSGGTGVTSVTTTPTATSFAGWDANRNLSANNHIDGYTTTVTAAGNTTLVVGSTEQQYFTGTTTQTVTLPVTSTLVLGQRFEIFNNSTSLVTVNSSGGNLVQTLSATSSVIVTVILTSGTTAASWSVAYRAVGSIPSTQTPNQANAMGTSRDHALEDHIHNIPTGVASTISTNANAQGSAAAFAQQDHTHQITAGSASLDSVPQYDNANWQAVNPEALIPQARAYRFSEDWICGSVSGQLNWTSTLTGGGSITTIGTTGVDSSHPGVVVITSGGAASRFATLSLGTNSLILSGGALTLECLINIQNLTNAAYRIGLGDQTAADHNNGVYLEYNSGTSPNWLIKTANGGTRTSTTTSTAVTANTWHKLVITVNAAATSVSYTLDGVSLGTITTNIPTTNTIAPNIMADSLAATTSTIWADYFSMYQRFTTTR